MTLSSVPHTAPSINQRLPRELRQRAPPGPPAQTANPNWGSGNTPTANPDRGSGDTLSANPNWGSGSTQTAYPYWGPGATQTQSHQPGPWLDQALASTHVALPTMPNSITPHQNQPHTLQPTTHTHITHTYTTLLHITGQPFTHPSMARTGVLGSPALIGPHWSQRKPVAQ
jgi:hypothetical protein